jgi:hypothetical protein
MIEIIVVLGDMWKLLSVEDKKPYEEQAEIDKLRYKKAMEVYKKNHS